MNKTILNMFICFRGDSHWKQNVDILESIEFPTSIPTSMGHHLGLAIQVLLDTNIEDSKSFCENISKLFPEPPIILIAPVNIELRGDRAIGNYFEDDLIEPGRYFDQLVEKDIQGIFIFDHGKHISEKTVRKKKN